MSTRKKNAVLPRQGKQKPSCRAVVTPPPSMLTLDLEAMLMVGEEHIVINQEENDNIGFMGELIDPV